METHHNNNVSICRYLLLEQHVEVMEVAVTPTDVPLFHSLAAIILPCNTHQVDCVLYTVLRTNTCQHATLTPVNQQYKHLPTRHTDTCQSTLRCWCGYLSAVSSIWLHMVQLMPLTPHHLLLRWNGLTFLVSAYQGCHGKEAVKVRGLSVSGTVDGLCPVAGSMANCSIHVCTQKHSTEMSERFTGILSWYVDSLLPSVGWKMSTSRGTEAVLFGQEGLAMRHNETLESMEGRWALCVYSSTALLTLSTTEIITGEVCTDLTVICTPRAWTYFSSAADWEQHSHDLIMMMMTTKCQSSQRHPATSTPASSHSWHTHRRQHTHDTRTHQLHHTHDTRTHQLHHTHDTHTHTIITLMTHTNTPSSHSWHTQTHHHHTHDTYKHTIITLMTHTNTPSSHSWHTHTPSSHSWHTHKHTVITLMTHTHHHHTHDTHKHTIITLMTHTNTPSSHSW